MLPVCQENKKEQVARLRILGIDPGLRTTGFGIVDVAGSRIRHVAHGTCQAKGSGMAERLCHLHELLSDMVRVHQPDTAAVEHTFVNKDAAGTLKLGQARAIALLVPAQFGL